MEPFYIGAVLLILFAGVCEVLAKCHECSGLGEYVGGNKCLLCRGTGLRYWRRK